MRSNWLEGMRFVKTQAAFDLEGSALPQQGPFPVSDEWGVKVACSMVLRSLDPGKNSKNIQFNTVRKMRAFFSNYCHASVNGAGFAFISGDGTGARLSHSSTNSLWFKRFSCGMHKRMGDQWMPDKAVSRYVIRACFSVLESDWSFYGIDNYSRLTIAKTACIIICGYYAAL